MPNRDPGPPQRPPDGGAPKYPPTVSPGQHARQIAVGPGFFGIAEMLQKPPFR